MEKEIVDSTYNQAIKMLDDIEKEFDVKMSIKDDSLTVNPEFLKWKSAHQTIGNFLYCGVRTEGNKKTEIVYMPAGSEVKLHYHSDVRETIKVIDGIIYFEHYEDKNGERLIKKGELKAGDSLRIELTCQAHYVLSAKGISLLYVEFCSD